MKRDQITFTAVCPLCGDRFYRTCDQDLVTPGEAKAELACWGPCPACSDYYPTKQETALDYLTA